MLAVAVDTGYLLCALQVLHFTPIVCCSLSTGFACPGHRGWDVERGGRREELDLALKTLPIQTLGTPVSFPYVSPARCNTSGM